MDGLAAVPVALGFRAVVATGQIFREVQRQMIRSSVFRGLLISAAAASGLWLAASGTALGAGFMTFTPASGPPSTRAELTIRSDVLLGAGSHVCVRLRPQGSTLTEDPRTFDVGEAMFDASGVAVLPFTVAQRPPGAYVTELGYDGCSQEFWSAGPPDAIFTVTAGGEPSGSGLPNVAVSLTSANGVAPALETIGLLLLVSSGVLSMTLRAMHRGGVSDRA